MIDKQKIYLMIVFWLSLLIVGVFIFYGSVAIERIKTKERIEMAKLNLVDKYFKEMERQEKLLEVGKSLDIKRGNHK